MNCLSILSKVYLIIQAKEDDYLKLDDNEKKSKRKEHIQEIINLLNDSKLKNDFEKIEFAK